MSRYTLDELVIKAKLKQMKDVKYADIKEKTGEMEKIKEKLISITQSNNDKIEQEHDKSSKYGFRIGLYITEGRWYNVRYTQHIEMTLNFDVSEHISHVSSIYTKFMGDKLVIRDCLYCQNELRDIDGLIEYMKQKIEETKQYIRKLENKEKIDEPIRVYIPRVSIAIPEAIIIKNKEDLFISRLVWIKKYKELEDKINDIFEYSREYNDVLHKFLLAITKNVYENMQKNNF